MRILLTGYYGKANFGDDVLLKVTYSRVREWQSGAEITILCDDYRDDYIPALIGENPQLIKPGDNGHYDLIIHGGGGTFFDFDNYGLADSIINQVIKTGGLKNYAAFDKLIRKILGKQRLSSKKRLGWGLGFGTYSAGSKKLRHNIPTLLDFNELVVRDTVSMNNLRLLGLNERVILGSDLAFLDDYWVPASVRNDHITQRARPRLGLILRDWMTGSMKNYLEDMAELLPELEKRYELSLFIFDKRVDKQLLILARPYTVHIWSPPDTNFVQFCTLLSAQDVLVSSRAHGAMCGAVLGVPSVLLEIEPKLQTIHKILPHATSLIRASDFTPSHLTDMIYESLCCETQALTKDVEHNKALIHSALNRTLLVAHD